MPHGRMIRTTTPVAFVFGIAVVLVYATTTRTTSSYAWRNSERKNKDTTTQRYLEQLSSGRRNAITQISSLVAAFSIVGVPAVPSSHGVGVSSTSSSYDNNNQQRRTTDEIRRIYDAGAVSYESVYTESVVSKALDFSSLRTNLLQKASGDVLEIGVGTGLNLPHYPPTTTITSYTGIDLSTKMMELARRRFERGSPQVLSSLEALYKNNKINFVVGDVTNLEEVFGTTSTSSTAAPSAAAKFDTVVDTFGLCVFLEPEKALAQAQKVLKPGGKLLLLEHQDSLVSKTLGPTRSIADVSGTCRYDDDVRALVKGAGFSITSSKNLAVGFLVEIVATKD